jgi:hypothetical protein
MHILAMATGSMGPSFVILLEAYRGRDRPAVTPKRPDVVAIQLFPGLSPLNSGQGPRQHQSHGHVLVECTTAIHNTPSRWKDVIWEATERLYISHPTRPVGIIIAVGLYCMWFIWDPYHNLRGSQQ